VAGFVGSPAMNFVRTRLEKENGGLAAVFGNVRISLLKEVVQRARDIERFVGKEVVLGIRPEDIEDANHIEDARLAENRQRASTLEVEPQVIESMGSEKYLYFEVAGEQAAHLESLGDMTGEEGGNGASPDSSTSGDMMVARVAAESTAKEGQQMRLVIDASKVQLFDPETEKAIF